MLRYASFGFPGFPADSAKVQRMYVRLQRLLEIC